MLELIFQGFLEWTYGLILECWEYFSSVLFDLMSLDFAYRYVVRQYIQPQLGAAPLYALTEQRVADFYRKLQEQGLSAKSTRDVGVLLRAILRMAAKRGCFCTGLNAELPAYRKRQVEISDGDATGHPACQREQGL